MQVRRLQEDLKAEERRSGQLEASLTVLERMARQTTAQLENERARVKRRDAEIMGLRERADVAIHNRVPLEKKALEPIRERLLVAGGSQALAARLRQCMPEAVFVPEDSAATLDLSVVRGCSAVVVLTAHVSHALADRVADEARRQGVPVVLSGWSNAQRIVSAVQQALNPHS
jgi:UDP-N-acetylglucosamine:LPS N-acetylglucosamine transferase